MKNFKGICKEYKYYIVFGGVGLALTPPAIYAAYKERGYFAVGGEYLIFILFLCIASIIDNAVYERKRRKEKNVDKATAK